MSQAPMRPGRRRGALSLLVIGFGGMLVAATLGLPAFGDPESPASTHVSDDYIENAYHDAHTPNIVTVMIADYRSFDTFGETLVIFTAGMACLFILRTGRRTDDAGTP